MSSDPTAPDLAERDRSIRVNSCTTVVGRAAVPEPAFRAYWRDVHGALCSRVPGLDWYVQHHFAARRDAHLWPRPDGVGDIPGYRLDGLVEIGWSSAERQAEFQEASSILFSDEQNVFEETAAYPLPDGSTTVLDRTRDATPNGADPYDRVHLHVQPREGAADTLAPWALGALADAARASADVVKLRVHLPGPHDNSAPNPPAPAVEHTVPAERVHLAMVEIAFHDSLARRRFAGTELFAASQAALGHSAAALTAFPVSGVHVFVRDGRLTTAGLRGSRVAELISDLAAANQVSDPVQHLMRTGELLD